MDSNEYQSRVVSDKYDSNDYGKWVRLSDSYPPVGSVVEMLTDFGYPTFTSIECKDEDVVLTNEELNDDVLRNGYCGNLYWRFLPPAPMNNTYQI